MRIKIRAAASLCVLLAATGCEHGMYEGTPPLSTYGEANRQTMMAQVVDPTPVYDELNPPTSAEKAGVAEERYRNDQVKKPKSTSISSTGSGGS